MVSFQITELLAELRLPKISPECSGTAPLIRELFGRGFMRSQAGETTKIRRRVVRESSVSWHHGGL